MPDPKVGDPMTTGERVEAAIVGTTGSALSFVVTVLSGGIAAPAALLTGAVNRSRLKAAITGKHTKWTIPETESRDGDPSL